MIELLDDEYWSSRFEITFDDRNLIAEQLECVHAPQDWQVIALPFVKAKLEHDQDSKQEFPREQIENRQSRSLDQRPEMIMIQYGERIRDCLANALGQDPRFSGLEDKWYLRHKLPYISSEALQALHRFLIQNQPTFLDAILPAIKDNSTADPLLAKMAIYAALESLPERFEKIGSSAPPEWKARLPEHDQAKVTHYAFDPRTFEILCRPGQRLSQKKAQRLQELNLYAHVVTFPEWCPMVSH